ncbi:MFS transporter [Bordetella genomosp. 1]|uniref:MFS transporter n=1 Tax=Bordetella genomosp. 1 TaxID=1395607 RepID=A0A261S6C6_9BORD|nr:MFS transporter [Bordetella genomosp. 1]OZI32671.1 MFS transporter [Bordetella genomosp. 1]
MTSSHRLFIASCLSIMTTSMMFSIRADVLQPVADAYHLSNAMIGMTMSSAFWGFTLGIIASGLIVDLVGMKRLHVFSAAAYLAGIALILWAPAPAVGAASPVHVFDAPGPTLLYFGFLVTGIAQGAVEGVTNPLVATLFRHDKRRMLHKLHAWWPCGLIVGGLTAWTLARLGLGWQVRLASVALPVLAYLYLILPLRYPASERVHAQISGMQMLREARRPAFILLFAVMWLTAATELAPDQWFAKIMADILPALSHGSILFLVYTAGLMFVLRQYAAGWLLHRLSPFSVLTCSAALALAGLMTLALLDPNSLQAGAIALLGATLFGVGKTFFWPTMLALTSEQFPRGGALLLNLVGGAGMLSVMVAMPVLGRIMDRSDTQQALLQFSVLPALLILIFGAVWAWQRRGGGYAPQTLQ